MCYLSNLGEKWIFAGHCNATFCLNFTINFKKINFFKCRFFVYQNWWKVRRTMTANGKKITMPGSEPYWDFPGQKPSKFGLNLLILTFFDF